MAAAASSRSRPATASLIRRRAREFWGDYERWIVAALWVSALGTGYYGFRLHSPDYARQHGGQALSGLDCLFLTLQLFKVGGASVTPGVHNGWYQAARILAPATGLITVLSVVVPLYRKQLRYLLYRAAKGHTVVCGLGARGAALAAELAESGSSVVAIERDAGCDALRAANDRGVLTLVGDATDAELLRRARAQYAKHVLCLCSDDATNAQIALQVQALAAPRRASRRRRDLRPVTAIVHLRDPQLCLLLRQQEIERGRGARFRIEFIDLDEADAHALIVGYRLLEDDRPQLVVLGEGRLARCLITTAARRWWFDGGEEQSPLAVTVISPQATRLAAELSAAYPRLAAACTLTPVDLQFDAAGVEEAEQLVAKAAPLLTAALVCTGDDSANLTLGLRLGRRLQGTPAKLIVQTACSSGLAALFPAGGTAGQVSIFCPLEGVGMAELLGVGAYESIARAVHETYLAHVAAATAPPGPLAVPWERLSDLDREESRLFAADIPRKLALIGCCLMPQADWDAPLFALGGEQLELLAQAEHERWLEVKRRQGLRYGPTRGPHTHPDMLPWAKLSPAVQEVDREIVRRLPAALARAGLQICDPSQ